MQKYVLSLILLVSFVAFSPDASAACLTLKRNLSIGSTGSDVAALQDFLYPVYMRYYAPSGRGTYGNFTKGAVMKFQMTFGISQTGTAGPATREKIRQISCGLSSSSAKPSTTNTNATNPAYNTTYNTTGTTNTSSVYCTKPPKLCSDGKTLVIGRGPACIYDACPSETLANSGTSMCANERLVCDNGSTVGRTGPNCAFAACPTSTNTTTNSDGTKRCSDGSTVGQYEMCYQTCSNGVRILDTQSCSMFGSAVTTPNTNTGTMVCAQDVYMCSNGSYVTRSGSSCTFPLCPTGGTNTNIPATQYCTQEAFICPNGVGVFRTGPNCAFATCPTTTTTNGTFKPIDTGTNGQTILPTTSISLTSTASAIGVEVPFTNLPNNAPLNKLFQTTIDVEKNTYIFRSFGLDQEQAVTYRVDIPEWLDGVQFRVVTNQNTEGIDVPRFISISETRGDFDTNKLIAGNPCYQQGLHTNSEFYTSKNGRIAYEYEEGGSYRNNISNTNLTGAQLDAMKRSSCIVVPGKTYYINVRFTISTTETYATAISPNEIKITDGCTYARRANNSVQKCGTLVQIVHSGKIDILKQLATSGANTTYTSTVSNSINNGFFKPSDVALNGQTIRFENQQGTGNTFLNGEHGLAVSTAGSIATPALSKLYQTAFDFIYASGYFMRSKLTLKPNEAFSVRVDIPLNYDGIIGTIETNENSLGAVTPSTFISISETRGDFNTSKVLVSNGSIYTGNPCYRSGKIPVVTFYTSSTGEYPSKYQNGASTAMSASTANFTKNTQCRLIPGKTYYFNVRSQSPVDKPNEDSCAVVTSGWANPVCGILVRIGYGGPTPLNPVGTWNSLGATGSQTPKQDITVDGTVIPNPSLVSGQIVPARNGGDVTRNGLSSTINAYSVSDISPCNTSKRSTTNPITRLWQHNINIESFIDEARVNSFGMYPNEAFTYRFTPTRIGTGSIKTEDGTGGASVPTFISISKSPCDFDIEKLKPATSDACYSSNIMPANGLFWKVATSASSDKSCTLIQGETYYLNMRFIDGRVFDGRDKVDSCKNFSDYIGNPTLKCGGIFQFRSS